MSDFDVTIAGGGMTGLAAAYRLRQAAPHLRIGILEAAEQLGGKVGTEQFEGFRLERGADSFLSRKPRGVGLCEELGIAGQLVGRDPRYARTYVLRNGRLHRLPEGLTGLIPTNLEALAQTELLSEAAKIRLAQERHLPAQADNGDESLAHFIARRLGQEALDYLVEPLMGGIYAGQVDQLSLAATFPQLRQVEMTHGSLLGGLAGRPPVAVGADYPAFVSFDGGMQVLVSKLIAALDGVDIRRRTTVTRIIRSSDGYRLFTSNEEQGDQTIHSAAVIVAVPAYAGGRLLSTLDRELAGQLSAIPYASTTLVSLAFEESLVSELNGYGYVIPRVEGREVLACTWTSRKWQNRAPAGKLLLRLFIGRYGQADPTQYDDRRLLSIARTEIQETLKITTAPLFKRIERYPGAMPQYNLGHLQRVANIEALLAGHQGLMLAGAAFHGVGIPDCIASGERAARQAIEWLAT